jgi:hypothetical protein
MSLKKLGVALLAVFAMGAIVANSAYAENNWNATTGSWYTGASPGTKLAVGTGTVDYTVSGPSGFMTGSISGGVVRFDWTSTTGETCSASNPTSTTATIDCVSTTLHGVTVSGPGAVGCSTTTTITTKEISWLLGMNKAGTVATFKITPKAGEGTAFATIELTGSCANAGLYKLTGAFYAQAKNATGVFAKTQELSFSEAIQKDAGTATSLKFGTNGAFINGSLSGTAAVEWAGKEK